MKLCIPVRSPDGLESIIEAHLPKAEHLLLFNTETRQHEQISLRNQRPGGDGKIRMDAVLCGSIDRITLRNLIARGIRVYGTEAPVVAQAIAQYENGELNAAVMAAGGCHGGTHGHAGGGCCSGHGNGQVNHTESSDEHPPHCHSEGGGCSGHSHGHEAGGCCGDRAHPQSANAVPEKPRGGVLKIAVSSQNRKTVTGHAGKCRKFWIYEVMKGEVTGRTLLELPIEQAFHSAPSDQAHPLDDINILVTGEMGSGLKQRLMQRGIQGVITSETDPDQAVATLLAGAIEFLPSVRAEVAASCS